MGNKHDIEVAVFYFPQWHPDPQNEARHGKGWTEWPSLRVTKPRFPGHEQPKVPLWGELDESDPRVSEKQIEAAADHGVTCFWYDWYWDMGGSEGPFLQRALEEGFLQADNRDRVKFGLMWANHNQVNAERFDKMADYVIENYFIQDNYWRLDEGMMFSIYEMHTLIQGLGGIEQTKEALERFRRKTVEAGYPGLHINAIEWGIQDANLTVWGYSPDELVRELGVDSVSSYVWEHNGLLKPFPAAPYEQCADLAIPLWNELNDRLSVPYYPNVTMGWDPSPRMDQDQELIRGEYPYTSIIVDNTPEAFEKSLRDAKRFVEEAIPDGKPRIISLYAWNEWTEGGYLEPDTVHGMGYLEAIRKVFGTRAIGGSK